VTIALGARGVRGVVLDIEGTTTPISFVSDVLFPYARAHVRSWLDAHLAAGEGLAVERALALDWETEVERGESPPLLGVGPRPERVGALEAFVLWQMDRDRKSPGLKALQGQIWEAGYASGALRGDVYPDVPPSLERWRAAGLRIAIYSSGSVLAQRLLFSTTEHGDLTRYIDAYFDTTVGPKRAAASYQAIASALGIPGSSLLFVSDVVEELTAARTAAFQTVLCVREGPAPVPERGDAVRSLAEVIP
jgi:enolase-phosphatase E1